MQKRSSITTPSQSGRTAFWIRMMVIARYRQKSASASPICPNLLCVCADLATCPSRISVAMPQRKTTNASQDAVLRPPTNLPSRYEAPKPRSHVNTLARPSVGNKLLVCAWRLRPRCQNKSLCCQTTQNRKPGRKRSARSAPSKRKLKRIIATASVAIKSVVRTHERFRVGLSLAVLHDISQERRKKHHQPRGLNFSWRRVVRRSTTNCFSLSTVFFTLTISLIKNVSRETLLQSNPCVSRETLAMIAARYT